MAENERFEAAKANLTLARNHLELYRGLIGKSSNEQVKKLDAEMAKVMMEIENPGASEKIGGFWNRLTGWFKKESGEARTTKVIEGDSKAEVAGKK